MSTFKSYAWQEHREKERERNLKRLKKLLAVADRQESRGNRKIVKSMLKKYVSMLWGSNKTFEMKSPYYTARFKLVWRSDVEYEVDGRTVEIDPKSDKKGMDSILLTGIWLQAERWERNGPTVKQNYDLPMDLAADLEKNPQVQRILAKENRRLGAFCHSVDLLTKFMNLDDKMALWEEYLWDFNEDERR